MVVVFTQGGLTLCGVVFTQGGLTLSGGSFYSGWFDVVWWLFLLRVV